jgi:hypothetical protein
MDEFELKLVQQSLFVKKVTTFVKKLFLTFGDKPIKFKKEAFEWS